MERLPSSPSLQEEGLVECYGSNLEGLFRAPEIRVDPNESGEWPEFEIDCRERLAQSPEPDDMKSFLCLWLL